MGLIRLATSRPAWMPNAPKAAAATTVIRSSPTKLSSSPKRACLKWGADTDSPRSPPETTLKNDAQLGGSADSPKEHNEQKQGEGISVLDELCMGAVAGPEAGSLDDCEALFESEPSSAAHMESLEVPSEVERKAALGHVAPRYVSPRFPTKPKGPPVSLAPSSSMLPVTADQWKDSEQGHAAEARDDSENAGEKKSEARQEKGEKAFADGEGGF